MSPPRCFYGNWTVFSHFQMYTFINYTVYVMCNRALGCVEKLLSVVQKIRPVGCSLNGHPVSSEASGFLGKIAPHPSRFRRGKERPNGKTGPLLIKGETVIYLCRGIARSRGRILVLREGPPAVKLYARHLTVNGTN